MTVFCLLCVCVDYVVDVAFFEMTFHAVIVPDDCILSIVYMC